MLGDFLHEGSVIKFVDLFKFPLLGGDFELQGCALIRCFEDSISI